MAHASFVEIPGGQNPKIVSKEIYRNLGQEISSLSYNEKRDKILEFLRKNAHCQLNLTNLYNETKFTTVDTLCRWLIGCMELLAGPGILRTHLGRHGVGPQRVCGAKPPLPRTTITTRSAPGPCPLAVSGRSLSLHNTSEV